MCHRQYPKIVFSKSICGKNWNIFFSEKFADTLHVRFILYTSWSWHKIRLCAYWGCFLPFFFLGTHAIILVSSYFILQVRNNIMPNQDGSNHFDDIPLFYQ
jgi:hypothetical protein